jgi:hypothetical protein
MQIVPIFKDHTGGWRPENPINLISGIPICIAPDDERIALAKQQRKYDEFEQSITYHDFPNEPITKPGEVVMAYLQWQYKASFETEWRNLEGELFSEAIKKDNYPTRQIWILSPSPEASRGNDVRGKENPEKTKYSMNDLDIIHHHRKNLVFINQDSDHILMNIREWNKMIELPIGKKQQPQSDHITDTGVSAEQVLRLYPTHSSEYGKHYEKDEVLEAMEQYATLKAQSVLQDKEQQINDLISLNDQMTETYSNQLADKDKEIAELKSGLAKALGLLWNIRHETDYMPDMYYEWIDKIIHETDELNAFPGDSDNQFTPKNNIS